MSFTALLITCLATTPAQSFTLTPDNLAPLVEGCASALEGALGFEFERPIAARLATRDTLAQVVFEENRELFFRQLGDRAQADAQARQLALGVSQQLLAKYSWTEKAILVSAENFEDQSLDLELDELYSEAVVRLVLLHELVHMVDDGRHDLGALFAGTSSREEVLAASALIEGHAQQVARDLCQGQGLCEAFEIYTGAIGMLSPQAEQDLGELGARVVRAQVAEFRAQYVAGESFVRGIGERGGAEALERAFREPPRDMETILNPDWFLFPEQRPRVRGLERALRVLERHFPASAWTHQWFRLLPTQLSEVLRPLRAEDVEHVLATLVDNRGWRAEDAHGFMTAVLYELAGPDDAAFLVARTLELIQLQKAGETYSGVQVLSADYRQLEEASARGTLSRRTLEAQGIEFGAVAIYANAGVFAIELMALSDEPLDESRMVVLALELLERASEAPGPDGSFDREALGQVPGGWEVLETGGSGTPAAWSVAADAAAPSPGQLLRVAAAGSGQTFNLLLLERVFEPDVELTVKLRAESGDEDQGGGLVWRARDADNYYVTRWNPLEDNLRLYKVVDGVRSQLASADAAFDPGAWHELTAVAAGPRLSVFLDGELLLEHEDQTFTGAGRAGLWTKADASCAFDDFEVSW